MQNKELKINNESLRMQVEEFKKSVEIAKNSYELSEIQEKIREQRRWSEASPRLKILNSFLTGLKSRNNSSNSYYDELKINFTLSNNG